MIRIILLSTLFAAEPAPFAIRVVDDVTGRGVPLVELKTVNEVRFVTDSAGVAAIDEPGLAGLEVFFHVKSHGYEFPKDGFGYRGKALKLTPGGEATLKIHRVNIAERLYRVTGAGIYRDTVKLGRPAPIKEPLLNAKVFGQDSVLMSKYRGKLQWFWGDTNRPGYPLGNFHTPGATSELPGQGGLDPAVGVDLTYFVASNGFVRPTAELPGTGPTWVFGLASFRDEKGEEQLVAGYNKIKPPLETYERGVVVFDPKAERFKTLAKFPLDAPIYPTGHTLFFKENGETFLYYTTPFPLTRVRPRLADLADPLKYEAFTCLKSGSTLKKPEFDRGPDGKLRYAWRANAPAVDPREQAKFIREGKMNADEALLALRDVETGKAVIAHAGTVAWNAYRGRFVLITNETYGTSMLGEVWYAEAESPLGPWVYARKIVTHDQYSFYNPKHHPEFDQDGGRWIYFEGTYASTFSGNTDPTPRYDYNQMMYRLDLADPRLNLPVAVRDTAGAAPRFFALKRPAPGAVGFPKDAAEPRYFAWPEDSKDAPAAATLHHDGGRVWPAPAMAAIPATVNPEGGPAPCNSPQEP